MADPKTTLVSAWMAKARSDLGTAGKLSSGPDTYLDTAIYHCQQAAEKAIKALLVKNDLRFEKTHDLEVLIARAILVAPDLSELLDQADRLTPYAVAYRYPGEHLVPTAEEFAAALSAAEKIFSCVESLLSAESSSGNGAAETGNAD
ncbi:MAG: HEPN domain-containing protein [Thermoanaerobaculia bacterium]